MMHLTRLFECWSTDEDFPFLEAGESGFEGTSDFDVEGKGGKLSTTAALFEGSC